MPEHALNRPSRPLRLTPALAAITLAAGLAASVVTAGTSSEGGETASWSTDFDGGARGWQVVLDGVMGGLSTGRISSDDGVMRFAGRLRLENNGGFSQARTQVPASSFSGADGVELRVKGDGRTWNFDVRTSNIRRMATGYQITFDTRDGEWTTVRLAFDDFYLQSFGNRVRNAAPLDASLVESVGITLSDKKPGDFVIEVDALRSYRNDESPSQSLATRDRGSNGGGSGVDASARTIANDAADLATVARSAGLTTLLDLVAAADFGELLPGEPITILAPTNDAFAALPEAEVERLLSPSGRRDLRRILAHHVIVGRVPAATVFGLSGAETLAGQRVAIKAGPALTIDGRTVLATDVPFDGGLVHVIDGVLLPELRTVTEVAVETEPLSTLAALVTQAGLAEQLGPENDGPWTVFAPRNAAFEALPSDLVAALTAASGRSQLVSVLGFHVVPGRIRLADLPATEGLRTLSGEPVSVSFTNGRVQVGGASIVAADIETANGIVHLIDSVMLPPSLQDGSAASAGRGSMSPTMESLDRVARAAIIIERAVEIGAPLFNDGNVAACAATYTMALESVATLAGDALNSSERRILRDGLSAAAAEPDARERSWRLRATMDALFVQFLERARGIDA